MKRLLTSAAMLLSMAAQAQPIYTLNDYIENPYGYSVDPSGMTEENRRLCQIRSSQAWFIMRMRTDGTPKHIARQTFSGESKAERDRLEIILNVAYDVAQGIWTDTHNFMALASVGCITKRGGKLIKVDSWQ